MLSAHPWCQQGASRAAPGACQTGLCPAVHASGQRQGTVSLPSGWWLFPSCSVTTADNPEKWYLVSSGERQHPAGTYPPPPCATCTMRSTKFYRCSDDLSTIARHPMEATAPTRSLDILISSSKALSCNPSKTSRWKRRYIQWRVDIWWPSRCHGRSTFCLPWNKLPMEKSFTL